MADLTFGFGGAGTARSAEPRASFNARQRRRRLLVSPPVPHRILNDAPAEVRMYRAGRGKSGGEARFMMDASLK
jgi:hypothetical protein